MAARPDEIDHLGLDDLDRRVLRAIIEKFSGGPGRVGETIAASISEESDTIMDVVEPYLLQLGFLGAPRGAHGLAPTPTNTWRCPCPTTTRAGRKRSLFDANSG